MRLQSPSLILASLATVLVAPALVRPSSARADEPRSIGGDAGEPVAEGPDPTRLDVERLPPEAIAVTRDLYAHGFFVEGMLGGRGFAGGVGRLSDPGVFASVGFGLEITRWLWIKLSVEGSIHATDAPPPPGPTVFEVLGAIGEGRLQLDLSARVALWVGGQVGLASATGDVLQAYGIEDAADIAPVVGALAGFDWHLPNRHHSIGLAAGARFHPSLAGADGEATLGLWGAAYLRYVF